MRVLVTGANGFIGARVAAALSAAGHEVVAAVRRATALPGIHATIACDFARDTDAEIWKPRLAGIDAVVNCAGILRPTHRDTFAHVHVDAPLALFRACVACGVRRIVQLSALGAPEDGEFIASKHRADEALRALDLDAVILRPGLVYSALGAYGGTSLLRAMAALPGVLPLPQAGMQMLRPLALEDLAAAIVAALARPLERGEIIELVGPDVLTLRDYLLAWRRWFGLPPARLLATPRWLMQAAVTLGEYWGRGPLCRAIANLLERGRTGSDTALAQTQALLARAPTSLAASLAQRPAQPQDLLQARWYILRPLLLCALALLWLASGAIGLALPASAAQAALPGWSPEIARGAALSCSIADLGLGVLLLSGRRTRTALWLMLAMVIGYSIVIGIAVPSAWLDPFGGLLKNLPIAALLVTLLLLDETRR